MSPWTALLESLHSALIDELTERHPEPKPSLGLPSRHRELNQPSTTTDLMICEILFDESRGFAMVATEPGFSSSLKISPLELWETLLKRAGAEFMRRNIRPKVGNPRLVPAGEAVPAGYAEPTRVIWIPLNIPSGKCFLGLAV